MPTIQVIGLILALVVAYGSPTQQNDKAAGLPSPSQTAMRQTSQSTSGIDPDKSPRTKPSDSTPTQTQGASDLEREKLSLEIGKLRSDIAAGSKFEIIKAIGTFLTSLGIIGTLLLGINQQKQSRSSRDDERFERAVTRLGSEQIAERLTGLAGLKSFLQNADKARQISALNYLVNAGVIEADPTVRSAIENQFDSIQELGIAPEVLNEALTSARDRNRAVFGRAMTRFWATQSGAQERMVDSKFTEVPLGNLSPEEMAPLEISAKMIAALVRAGARINDLSGVYCVSCSFSSKKNPSNLKGVDFSGAILRRAEFISADLESASFHNADLILTNFIGANLVRAKLTADTQFEPWSLGAAFWSGELSSSWGTTFACADLSYSDFTGRMIFTLIFQNPIYGGNMRDEFYDANLLGANLKATTFTIAVPSSVSAQWATSQLSLEFSPMTNVSFSVMGKPLHYFKDLSVQLWSYFGSADASFKDLPNPYSRDLIVTMSGIASARNLNQAQLPDPIRRFIEQNPDALKTPLISYDCSTGQKKADISAMFAGGGPMTGNARF